LWIEKHGREFLSRPNLTREEEKVCYFKNETGRGGAGLAAGREELNNSSRILLGKSIGVCPLR
jgi:hypothetical protein